MCLQPSLHCEHRFLLKFLASVIFSSHRLAILSILTEGCTLFYIGSVLLMRVQTKGHSLNLTICQLGDSLANKKQFKHWHCFWNDHIGFSSSLGIDWRWYYQHIPMSNFVHTLKAIRPYNHRSIAPNLINYKNNEMMVLNGGFSFFKKNQPPKQLKRFSEKSVVQDTVRGLSSVLEINQNWNKIHYAHTHQFLQAYQKD